MPHYAYPLNDEQQRRFGDRKVGNLADSLLHDLRLARWDGTAGHDPLVLRAKLEALLPRLSNAGARELSIDELCKTNGALGMVLMQIVSSAVKSGVKI